MSMIGWPSCFARRVFLGDSVVGSETLCGSGKVGLGMGWLSGRELEIVEDGCYLEDLGRGNG